MLIIASIATRGSLQTTLTGGGVELLVVDVLSILEDLDTDCIVG
jgi:hypothetical protein